VRLATLIGANRNYILDHVPHISRLVVETLDELMGHAEVVVVGHDDAVHRQALSRLHGNQVIIDLVRIGEKQRSDEQYHGICW
jgi:GDP-mannose 6-dehydrogenase